MKKIDKIFCSLIEKYCSLIYVITIFFLSCAIRFYLRDGLSRDMEGCLLPWFHTLKENGGLAALKDSIGDYNIPYLFILALLTYLPFSPSDMIKIVSITFDFITAFIVPYIVYLLLPPGEPAKIKAISLYTGLCLNPLIILNSTYWGQCDIIYSFFLILCVLACCKEKYTLGIFFFSISFAFKLQAIFILPVLLCLYIRQKKFSILSFLMIPFVNLFLCLPALIAGRPLADILTIYLRQTSAYEYMSLNYPNIYYLFDFTYEPFGRCSVLFCLAVIGSGIFYLLHKHVIMNTHNTLYLSIWIIWTCIMFLPAMHERYGFSMEILLLIYAVIYKKRIFTVLILNLTILCTYSYYFFRVLPFDWPILSLINLLLYLSFTLAGIIDTAKSPDLTI